MVKPLLLRRFAALLSPLLALFMALSLSALAPLALAQQQKAAPVQAFVDSTRVTINDVITLTIRLDASMGNERPSFTGLNKDFEQVGGLSSRSTYTNVNNNIQSWTEYSITLRPLSIGTLTIPAFRVGSQSTDPIKIAVTEARTGTGGSSDEVFLRTSLSKKESYVQEQLIFTARVYYSIGLDQGAKLSAPEVENAVVQQLGTDNNLQEVVNGISYNVVERRYVIFPQQSGTMKVPPLHFSATVGHLGGINRFFSSPRTAIREIELNSEPLSVNVKPQPDSFDGTTWLPATGVKLEESWSGNLNDVHVGDAVTRNVTTTAAGLSSSLLPGIAYKDMNGLRFYPDQPVRSDSANADGVTGTRKESSAIVASQAGDFVIPEVKMPWWNTKTDRMEYATLPSRTIKVLPALNALDANSVSPSAASPALKGADGGNGGAQIGAIGSNPLWISTTVLFAVLWIATSFMLLRNRQQLAYAETTGTANIAVRMPDAVSGKTATAVTPPSADTALRVLKTACENRHLGDIRKAALKWGQAVFADQDLLTLDQLAADCGDANLASLLQRLDQALYGNGDAGTFDAKGLYERVALLHKQGFKRSGNGGKYALPPLYK
ncbi:MAG TPA: BatD family protein [Candidatus Acidoferrum sp.]|nr:BatD family protein [Candidatus Acidoferrum sp.]